MTDTPSPKQTRRDQASVTTGDVLILGTVITVLLTVVVVGGMVVW